MRISGSGHISAGDYEEKIGVSGSAKLDGKVRCQAFHCSGSAAATTDLECREDVAVSGSMSVNGILMAQKIHVSGSLSVGQECQAKEEIRVSGSLKCKGNVKSTAITIAGGIRCESGIEGEKVKISGNVQCDGLLNAEDIEIASERGTCSIGSIGGSNIKMYCKNAKSSVARMPLLEKLVGGSCRLEVKQSIEGDVVALENVITPLVVGRVVAIGIGCQIDLVQYSEEIEIHPEAKVKRYERV